MFSIKRNAKMWQVQQSLNMIILKKTKKTTSYVFPHPKDALFAGQWGSNPGPEEDVGLSTGHNGVWVGRMELHSQDHLIGRLSNTRAQLNQVHHSASLLWPPTWTFPAFLLWNECWWSTHFDLCHLWLLLPIPNCQHVVVTVIDHTEVLSRVLRDRDRYRQGWLWDLRNKDSNSSSSSETFWISQISALISDQLFSDLQQI